MGEFTFEHVFTKSVDIFLMKISFGKQLHRQLITSAYYVSVVAAEY